MIRQATEKDLPQLVHMGERWWSLEGTGDPFSAEALHEHLAMCLECGIILVSAVNARTLAGCIAVMLWPCPFTGLLVAGKAQWYTRPEYAGRGVALLRHAEEWARTAGAVRFECSVPRERAAKVLAHMGYEPRELGFRKVL